MQEINLYDINGELVAYIANDMERSYIHGMDMQCAILLKTMSMAGMDFILVGLLMT